jgi:lipopolysaccharide/colanic/teichoic acid biosynthesis glycosyltransferase
MRNALGVAFMNTTFYTRFGKRCFDLLVASLGILLISPLLVIVAVLVRCSGRGPVFFRQVRIGQFGRPFQIFKFRTMRAADATASQLTAAGDPRVTRLGAWLRRTKIDELPQLFNVVLGDMSLVGPRPEVPEFTAAYRPEQQRVFAARPGITGPSANVYEEELLASHLDKERFYVTTVMPAKLVVDLAYCENIAFKCDLYVLYQTFVKLLSRIYQPEKGLAHAPGHPLNLRAREK